LQQRGLSALFVAVWLRLCRVAGLLVSTHRIDKPLICLVLHRFAFRPSAHATAGRCSCVCAARRDDHSLLRVVSPALAVTWLPYEPSHSVEMC
jgi:hypothetical protein